MKPIMYRIYASNKEVYNFFDFNLTLANEVYEQNRDDIFKDEYRYKILRSRVINDFELHEDGVRYVVIKAPRPNELTRYSIDCGNGKFANIELTLSVSKWFKTMDGKFIGFERVQTQDQ